MAAGGKTEYQEEYCGMRGSKGRGGGDGSGPSEFVLCTKTEDIQPVGGRVSAKYHEEEQKRQAEIALLNKTQNAGSRRKDTLFSDPAMRAFEEQLYNQTLRGPPNRDFCYVNSPIMLSMDTTTCEPLAVPDVHKLRYMHNNYMTADDWY